LFEISSNTVYEEGRTIRIVEHPGYLEVMDEVFDIKPGSYTFLVRNETNKNSGFVVTKENEIPMVFTVKKGTTSEITINLKSGRYNLYCPLIPTPIYCLKVR
jgi:hypothetical protein